MDLKLLASKNVAILGMGIEGLALASFLIDKCQKVTLLDRLTEEELLTRAGNGGDDKLLCLVRDDRYGRIFGLDYLDNLNQYDIIFRSPGIRLLLPELLQAKKEGVKISSQIKLFFDLCPGRVIGVTGTKGKGTTSSLIVEMLKANFQLQDSVSRKVFLAGNIGKTAIDLLPEIGEEDWVVLELSSFQLQDLHKSPHIAVALNISVDHLDYHSDEEEYHQAKSSIVKFQRGDDIAILNKDYSATLQLKEVAQSKVYLFSGLEKIENGAYVEEGQSIAESKVVLSISGEREEVCSGDEVKIVGKHNLENIAAAALAARLAGCELGAIRKVAKAFVGLPHRLELIGTVKGVAAYNDSFSTNPEPTMAAVRAIPESKLLILGGSTKGADFDEMGKVIAESNVKAVALIGDEAGNINRALEKNFYDGQVIEAGYDLRTAVSELMGISRAGDAMILSPGCASFDMFKNYKDRGEKFKQIISSYND